MLCLKAQPLLHVGTRGVDVRRPALEDSGSPISVARPSSAMEVGGALRRGEAAVVWRVVLVDSVLSLGGPVSPPKKHQLPRTRDAEQMP